VTIWVGDTGEIKHPIVERIIDSFQDGLRARSKIRVAKRETIQSADDAGMMNEILSVDRFRSLLVQSGGDDAVVSFVGVPHLTREELQQLPVDRPKIIAALNADVVLLRELFQQGVVQVAITPSTTHPPTEPQQPPQSPREWFDRYFMVATLANAASLPE
jgi:hypothetical protein